jgi:hypothetical protein
VSKTLTEIGLIVGGLALAVFAGPVGIIALEGNVAVFQAMVGIGLTTALSGVGLALRQTPKPVGTSNSISFTSGPSPRRVLYGRFQTAGVLTYASFPPKENIATTTQNLHLIYTLVSHEITSFDAIEIDGSLYNFGTDLVFGADGYWHVVPSGSALINDFYWQHMSFEFHCGNPQDPLQPFPNLAAVDPAWTSACMQTGCAKVHVVLRADSGWPAVFPSGQIPNFQFFVNGKRLIDPRIVTAWQASHTYALLSWIIDNNGIYWYASLGGASGSSRPNFEANDGTAGNTLTDGTVTWTNTGQTTPALSSNTRGSKVRGTSVSGFTNGRLMADAWQPNTTYAQFTLIEAPVGYLQITLGGTAAGGDVNHYPQFSTVQGGMTVDNGVTWNCLGRSTTAINPSNPALVVNDYLQDRDYGMGAPLSTIDINSVIAAANTCEEQVLIIFAADGGQTFENRYACDGIFDHSSVRGNVLTALCGSMAGWVVPPGDLWHVFAGAYINPSITIGDNDLRRGIKGDFRLSKRDIANGVKGKFIPAFLPSNPAAQNGLTQVPPTWQAASFPAYQANGMAGKPDFITEDGGQIIWQDIQLDFTTSLWMAQRLAKITLMRLRFQQTLTLACKLTALNLEAGDTFTFAHLRWGITAGVFEATQVSVILDNSNRDAPALGIDIVGRQTDPSIYEFTPPSSSSDFGEYSPYGITGVMTGVE